MKEWSSKGLPEMWHPPGWGHSTYNHLGQKQYQELMRSVAPTCPTSTANEQGRPVLSQLYFTRCGFLCEHSFFTITCHICKYFIQLGQSPKQMVLAFHIHLLEDMWRPIVDSGHWTDNISTTVHTLTHCLCIIYLKPQWSPFIIAVLPTPHKSELG